MTLGDFDEPVPYLGQEYKILKKESQKYGRRFEDSRFILNNEEVLHFTTQQKDYWKKKGIAIQWKRPHELVENPRFIDKSPCPNDCKQGYLGDDWFIAACSAITKDEELWSRVIPDYKEQEWDSKHPEKHPGIFHFRLYRHGDWVDVVVDDRLPCVVDELTYLSSEGGNVFWCALLEKAYAKFNNYSYKSISTGFTSDALVDFTGGIAETIDLKGEGVKPRNDDLKEHFRIMKKEFNRDSLLSACIYMYTEEGKEKDNIYTDEGLVRHLAYSITSIQKVPVTSNIESIFFEKPGANESTSGLKNPSGSKGEKLLTTSVTMENEPEIKSSIFSFFSRSKKKEDLPIKLPASGSQSSLYSPSEKNELPMIRLRSPWGSLKKNWGTAKWEGRFKPGSDDWDAVSKSWKNKNTPEWKNKNKPECEKGGEFWMAFEDFCEQFENVTICRRVNKSFFSPHKRYYEMKFHGAWAPGRCGGSQGGGLMVNPQYIFDVEKENGDEDVMIYLQQKRPKTIGNFRQIGFKVAKVELNRKFRINEDISKTMHEFLNTPVCQDEEFPRAVFWRHTLQQGRYLIIPYMNTPDNMGPFLLRVYTSEKNQATELTRERVTSDIPCIRSATLATRIKVVCAEGLQLENSMALEHRSKTAAPNLYCVITHDSKAVQTRAVKYENGKAEWKEFCIFYRHNLEIPIKIVIYNDRNLVKDDYVGKAKFCPTSSSDVINGKLSLTDCKKNGNKRVEGKLTVAVSNIRE